MKHNFNLVVSDTDIDQILAQTVSDEAQRVAIRDAFTKLHETKSAAAKAWQDAVNNFDYGAALSINSALRFHCTDKQREVSDDDLYLVHRTVAMTVKKVKESSSALPCEKFYFIRFLAAKTLDVFFDAKDAGKSNEEIKLALDQMHTDFFDAGGQYIGGTPEPEPTLWQAFVSDIRSFPSDVRAYFNRKPR